MKIYKQYKINVVIPFVTMGDIAFLLLIFLIVTSSIQKLPDIKFQLPQSTQFDKIKNNDNLEILIDQDNQIYIEEQIYTLNELQSSLFKGKKCIISADAKASFQLIHNIIDIVKEKNYEKVIFTVKRETTINKGE